jgi:hypothetical protein
MKNKHKHSPIPLLVNYLVWLNGKKIYTLSDANASDRFGTPDKTKHGLRNRGQSSINNK